MFLSGHGSHIIKNNVFKICTLVVPDNVIFQNGRLNKKKNTRDRCLRHFPAKMGFLVHDDVIREAQKFIFVMFLKSLGLFELIDNSNYDEKICFLRYRYMTFFS